MRRHFGLFFDYLTQYIKVRLSYRGDFFISIFTSFAATISSFLFLVVLFTKIPNLQGWSFYEMMFLYSFGLIPYGLFNIISLNLYDFGNNYIIEGKFDRVLLRPVSSLFQVLFETFRVESFQEVATGLFGLGLASYKLHLSWGPLNSLLLILWSLCGAVIYVSIFLMLSTVSFWFEDRIGVHPPVWNLIAFGRYPLSIYSAVIQFFLCWIIPFGLASFYPSVRLLGRSVTPEYASLVPVVAAVFLTLSISLWNFGTRHYSSTGS
ncbi:MAG TPA: ABC-2 family transporter protein [Candidatus Acidoferrales bacterium]|jgi:ABC-2 type transport system permease protein|nr:ABC-2 family transporter protein [Candidatus Acidoferrales bacterium]